MIIQYVVLLLGYFIAFVGGSLSMIIYQDAIEQGKGKRVGRLRSMIAALITSVIVSLLMVLGHGF